ncbi:restriction endonuclease subunit S [Enterococcus faecalis]|nr:restriction endonuclease subunit S [Enterococcus faecalis]
MLEIQKKIGDFYKSCSKKIELNNQIINTLEKTATTLFNHWFIDFEFPDKNGNPYKSSGGKLIESELGEIPEGWEVSSLKNVTEIIMGQSPKGTSYNNENIGLPLINGASDFKNGFVNPKKYTTEPKKVTKKADIIFGVRATIGNPTIVQQEYAIGRGAGIARVIDNHYQEFVFLLLEEMFKYFSNTGSGSVYINISKNDFESYKFVHPSLEVILKFHESVMSIFELIANKRSEIESLKELRNTLLPKLLSGEIELE